MNLYVSLNSNRKNENMAFTTKQLQRFRVERYAVVVAKIGSTTFGCNVRNLIIFEDSHDFSGQKGTKIIPNLGAGTFLWEILN